MAVKVEVKSESGTSRDPAKILVYEDDRLVAEVVAEVELKQGADGGLYHCVTLKKIDFQNTYSCLLCGTTTPMPHVCPVFYPELRR